jgi:hypothetical protein
MSNSDAAPNGASDKPAPLGPEDEIGQNRPPKNVVISISALLLALLLVSALGRIFPVDCTNYFLMWLAYPLIFGAAGYVLGGAMRLRGKLPILGFTWTGDIAGGIAAAALGVAIIGFVQRPACANDLKHELKITDLPLAQPDPDQIAKLNYFVTVEPDSNVDLEMLGQGNKRTLQIAFRGNSSAQLLIRAYRTNDAGYEFVTSCTINFTVTDSEPSGAQDVTVHRSKSETQLTLGFNPEYFSQLKADKDRYRNLCLKGLFKADDADNYLSVSVIPELQITKIPKKMYVLGDEDKLRLTFLTDKPRSTTDPKEAAKLAAHEGVVSTGEVLTSTGTGNASSAAVVKQASVALTIDAAKPNIGPVQTSAQCAFVNDDLKNTVDRFLLGDDLDKPTRKQMYDRWADRV